MNSLLPDVNYFKQDFFLSGKLLARLLVSQITDGGILHRFFCVIHLDEPDNTVSIASDLVRIARGCSLGSPTAISVVDKLCARISAEDEPNSSSLPKSVQTLGKDVVHSPSSRLVQASHQFAAALISTPTPNGLLFVTEGNAKSRVPGHGIQMHEKLSARSRRR